MKTIFLTLLFTMIFTNMKTSFKANEALSAYCRSLTQDFELIDKKRKVQLEEIAAYIKDKRKKNEPIKLTFICTHNSRRSHFGQAWAKVAAGYYGVENVETYSGGTEVTAVNPRAMSALKRAGFIHAVENRPLNPRNILRMSDEDEGQVFFSKKFSDEANPKTGFAAIMVCSSADEACPVVLGAEKRFAIPYTDPKIADDTPEESATYDERCKQIAREVFYMFSKAK